MPDILGKAEVASSILADGTTASGGFPPMTEPPGRHPPPSKPVGDPKAARLAQALRDNLRRRKALAAIHDPHSETAAHAPQGEAAGHEPHGEADTDKPQGDADAGLRDRPGGGPREG